MSSHAVGYKQYYDNVAHDCSRGKTYKFSTKDQYYYMTNWVREDGYKIGGIAANPDYGYKFSATGNWSPDNKNKY